MVNGSPLSYNPMQNILKKKKRNTATLDKTEKPWHLLLSNLMRGSAKNIISAGQTGHKSELSCSLEVFVRSSVFYNRYQVMVHGTYNHGAKFNACRFSFCRATSRGHIFKVINI